MEKIREIHGFDLDLIEEFTASLEEGVAKGKIKQEDPDKIYER